MIKHTCISIFLLFSLSTLANSQDTCKYYKDSLTDQFIYTAVTKNPIYGNSESDFVNYIFNRANIQQDDLSTNIYHSWVGFIVSKNGTLSNIEIIRGGEKMVNEKIISIISKMPLWKPGLCYNDTVNTYIVESLMLEFRK